MTHPFDNDFNEDGSAGIASEAEIEAAGMFDYAPDAIYAGTAYGRRLWLKLSGGLLMVAGARSGKLVGMLGYNICHGILSTESLLIVDVKGELAAISRDQTPDCKHCIYWNPRALFDLPSDKINPTGHLRWSSPDLIADIKSLMEALLPESGSGNAKFFEFSARFVGEALARSIAELDGEVTLPRLYDAIMALQAGGPEWEPYSDDMKASSADDVRRMAVQIEVAQADSSGGWRGIVGELAQCLSCLSDPMLRASVTGPFDFDLADFARGTRRHQLYLICQEWLVEPWAPVVKALMNAARVLKARAPEAPRQTWIIDEAARFKGYSEIADLFTVGAGLGIRPIAVFQDISQMNDLGPNAQRKIMSSAEAQLYFGVRDLESAKHVSEMLGVETLRYDDPVAQGRAKAELLKLVRSLFDGRPLSEIFVDLNRTRFEANHRIKQRRYVQTADEILNMARADGVLFTDGLNGAVNVQLLRYILQVWMAGRFHPNPYHGRLDEVTVQTEHGPERRPVIAQDVPERYADYPQYRDGKMTVIGEDPL
ncbi:MAG: type IV secretory system conjugative DNA transfer family protein [Pseudomonadota bacterium]